MNASAFRPSTIEALKALWVALPLRASNDGDVGDPRERQMQILDTYCFALSEFSSEAIMNTVNNLRAGKIDEASKNFCPKAPELAVFVRAEQKRIDILKAPKHLPYLAAKSDFKDWRIIHRQRTEELADDGFRLLRSAISLDEFVLLGRRKALPTGSIWFWSLQEVWGSMQ